MADKASKIEIVAMAAEGSPNEVSAVSLRAEGVNLNGLAIRNSDGEAISFLRGEQVWELAQGLATWCKANGFTK